MSSSRANVFMVELTRWQSLKLRFTWPYIRQTRLLYPVTMWWLNRGYGGLR